jgi:hypothetical protein
MIAAGESACESVERSVRVGEDRAGLLDGRRRGETPAGSGKLAAYSRRTITSGSCSGGGSGAGPLLPAGTAVEVEAAHKSQPRNPSAPEDRREESHAYHSWQHLQQFPCRIENAADQ